MMAEEVLYLEQEIDIIKEWIKQTPLDPGGELQAASLVAEICLSSIRADLPNWRSSQQYRLQGRKFPLISVKKRDSILVPRHLFTINWADSAPGFSWPEAYYVTLLPQFDLHVVTISQETSDMYGVNDVAIHCFKENKTSSVPIRALDAIQLWWREQLKFEQAEWENWIEGGLVSEAQARAASGEVWGYEVEDEDG